MNSAARSNARPRCPVGAKGGDGCRTPSRTEPPLPPAATGGREWGGLPDGARLYEVAAQHEHVGRLLSGEHEQVVEGRHVENRCIAVSGVDLASGVPGARSGRK